MNEHTVYWVWLQQAMGAGARVDDLLGAFSTAGTLYRSTELERRLSGVLTARQLARLEKVTLADASAITDRCAALGQTVVTPEDDAYPAALRTLTDMPLALYVRGDLSCLRDALSIAVVGSRNASLYSLGVARSLSGDLARAGAVVVSGCALGVDSASHEGAIYAGGNTVGVLGCGLNTPYLMTNAALRENVAQNGALISEYPPDAKALPAHFPLRNRIISGLCAGTVVIEASEKSGSLITARYAAEQGRDVFGVPGDLTSRNFTGVHALIRDGAKPVFSARDILQEYAWIYDDLQLEALSDRLRVPETRQPSPEKAKPAEPKRALRRKMPTADLSADARTVYDAMGVDALYTDDLVQATKLEPNRVSTALTELEIFGFIQMIEGKRYRIIED